MCVDSLEQTQNDPDVHGQNVQVTREVAKKERTADRAHTQYKHLEWVRVLSSQTERRTVLVMELVNVLVQRTPMHGTVNPVMEHVLKHEEDENLPGHLPHAWEWHLMCSHSKVLANRVETPNLGQFDRKVTEQHKFGAAPLLCRAGYVARLDFVLAQRRDRVNNHPWD